MVVISTLQLAGVGSAQVQTVKAGIDPARLAYVERLVMKPSDIVPWGENMSNEEVAREKKRLMAMEAKREMEIQSSPDLKPYLFHLLDRYYIQSKSPDVVQVLSAIGLRNDLSEEEVAPIKNEIRSITKIPYDKSGNNYLDNFYLMGASKVLGTKKSQENEELALAILDRARDPALAAMAIAPAEALSRIGTSRSIPSLASALRWLQLVAKANNDETARQAAFRVSRSLDTLKERVGVAQ